MLELVLHCTMYIFFRLLFLSSSFLFIKMIIRRVAGLRQLCHFAKSKRVGLRNDVEPISHCHLRSHNGVTGIITGITQEPCVPKSTKSTKSSESPGSPLLSSRPTRPCCTCNNTLYLGGATSRIRRTRVPFRRSRTVRCAEGDP